MAVLILDSWALMALFHAEPAADEVERLLAMAADGRHQLLMSVVNWGEIYYSIRRGVSAAMAEGKMQEIAGMPLQIIAADLPQTYRAACLKATHKLSYADCFGAALAQMHAAALVTGDPEFKALEKTIRIRWLASNS